MFKLPPLHHLLLPALCIVLGLSGALAADASPANDYRTVELAKFVDQSRTPAGQRIILRPTGVSFVATLHRLPEPQTTAYLRQVLGMMKVAEAGDVTQRIVVSFGKDRFLPVYIEAAAAKRLSQNARAGERRRFYALHVYNYSKGPALVVTTFGERE